MRSETLLAATATLLVLTSTGLAQCGSECKASSPDFRWQAPAGWSLLASGAG